MIGVNGQLSDVYNLPETMKGFKHIHEFATESSVTRLIWELLHSEESE